MYLISYVFYEVSIGIFILREISIGIFIRSVTKCSIPFRLQLPDDRKTELQLTIVLFYTFRPKRELNALKDVFQKKVELRNA